MKPGDTITIMADTLSRHGDGVGTYEGFEVHVAGLLPGETGDVALDYVSRQRPRAHGSVVLRRNTHPGRRPAPCAHHGMCTGCPLMDLDAASQRELKQRELFDRYGIAVDRLVTANEAGLNYRWSSKRVFAGPPGNVTLGSYMRGTHNVADMTGCIVDHPDIVACIEELHAVVNELGAPPYDEIEEEGELRYAWFKTDGAGKVLVALISATPDAPHIKEIAARLKRPVGVTWGVNGRRSNDMRGMTLRPVWGQQTLEFDLAGVHIHIGPQGFLQPNPVTASLAYADLVALPAGGAPHGRLALDLYAGAGVTTALLRRRFDTVLPCESYPESARALGVPPLLVEEFLAGFLAEGKHKHADLVIANPPRGGLGPAVCDQLNRLRAPRLHIMSCSPFSLREDLKRLTDERGAYRLIACRAYDTLPQTSHVEVVAWLVGRS